VMGQKPRASLTGRSFITRGGVAAVWFGSRGQRVRRRLEVGVDGKAEVGVKSGCGYRAGRCR